MAAAIGNPLVKPLGITASILGIVQGLGWTVLALLSILYYEEVIEVEDGYLSEYSRNSGNNFTTSYTMYYNFFQRGFVPDEEVIVSPNALNIFSWIYLFSSFIWFIVSAGLFWILLRKKTMGLAGTMGFWSVLTCLISILDIVLMSLFASDFSYYNENYYTDIELLLACGILLILASKGFILWIVNVVFAIVTATFTMSLIRNKPRDGRADTTPISAYMPPSGTSAPPWLRGSPEREPEQPRPWSYEHRPESVINEAFDFMTERSLERSQSFRNVGSEDYYRRGGPSRYSAGRSQPTTPPSYRVATVGRGRRSPPNPGYQPRRPIIPAPDYTPPGSPTFRKPALKSVLKSRSQYT